MVLDLDSDLNPGKPGTEDLVSLLNLSSSDSRELLSPTDFIQRNITAIKQFKRRETKPAPEPDPPPLRMPKPIAEDSHLLRLTQAARCKIVFSESKSRLSRSRTPEVTIRKVKRPNKPQGIEQDRAHSAPRIRPADLLDENVYQTPSFHETAEETQVEEVVVPRLKKGKSAFEKLAGKEEAKESFERSLQRIGANVRLEEPEPGFPDPFSGTVVMSSRTEQLGAKAKTVKDRPVPSAPLTELECVLSSESDSEAPEEIHRYLQHWFTLYYSDFRRQALQELLGVLIIRGNSKRAQRPLQGISQSERSNKRSKREVVTFREMEKRLDEVLSKGRAVITRAGSLTDAKSASNALFMERVTVFLTAQSGQLPAVEDPIELLKPPQIISTALDLGPEGIAQDSLTCDLLLHLFAPKRKLMERRHLALSLEAVELKAEALQGVLDYVAAAKKLLVLRQVEAAREALESVFRVTDEYKGKLREEYRLARQEAHLWIGWTLLLTHAMGKPVDRSVLTKALETLQVRPMAAKELETLRKICLLYLFYHTSLWRSEERAIAHLKTLGLGEWRVVIEADLQMRTEEALTEATAAEQLLLHLDSAAPVRFLAFMRLAQHYKDYYAYEKVLSAGRKALAAYPPLNREQSSLVLCVMLKAQGHLDATPLPQYQLLLDKGDFTFLYQFARVAIKTRATGASATVREALELLLAFAQDYAHMRQYLFHFSVLCTQFWRFLLFKINCFYRTATRQGCELLTLVPESPVQRQSVERFLGEIKEVKAALHLVYERCRRKDLQPGQWVEDTVRRVERLDPYLGLCLFIALEVRSRQKPATLGPYKQILKDYPSRFESYFVNWVRLYRLNKVREKQLKQIEGQEEIDKRDCNHPLSLLPQLKLRLDSIKLLYQDCLTVRLQCLWQMYGKGYGPMRLSDAYRIIQAKSYLRTNYQKAICKLKKATHSGRSAAAIVYYLLAKYMLELERSENRDVYRELKVYLNSFALQRDMDSRYQAKALCLHAEVEALAGHYG